MAASLKATGTWATLTADAAVTIPGTPAAGDRMYVFVAWKPFGGTAQITSPQAWTEITEFADGSVADGANVGSVKVAAYYRDWQSGDGNPTIDFSGAVIAGAVCQVWQKDTGDTWGTPTFVTAAISAADPFSATSSSTITITNDAVVFCLVGLRDDSSTWTRDSNTALDDDGSPAVTWNGNVVESPSAHLSTTTGNDLAVDLVHRFVTTGASGVNLTTTGDPAAAETGAALWVHQPVTVAINLAPSPAVLTVASPASTITTGAISLSPSPIVLNLDSVAPTLGLTLSLAPSPAVLAVASVAATVNVDSTINLNPSPAVLNLDSVTPALGLSLDLAATPAILNVDSVSPALGLSLSLAATPAVLNVDAPDSTVNIAGGGPTNLEPAPAVLNLASPSALLGLQLSLSPTPAILNLTPVAPALGLSLSLAPSPALVTLRATSPAGQVGPINIVSGSDHELILEMIAFWEAYDALGTDEARGLLLRQWLLEHGGKRRLRENFFIIEGGLMPVRITLEE